MTNRLLNCRGTLINLQKPIVMGILNVTHNSFYDGNLYLEKDAIKRQVEKMLIEGATIIDIGAASSRPGSVAPELNLELDNVLNALEIVFTCNKSIIVSIDTVHVSIAEEALKRGAHIINDISGGSEKMFETVAKYNAPYILMHMQGTPTTMQLNPNYVDVVADVMDFFSEKLSLLNAHTADVILDVGFGFGKNIEHNYSLLKALPCFSIFNKLMLVGVSRKSMITKALNLLPQQALHGTGVVHTLALLQGANIIRAHDVAEAMQCIALHEEYINAK